MDVCSFDAIEMSHEHELASFARAGARANLETLLSQGRRYMDTSNWVPANPEKNVAGVALEKKVSNSSPMTVVKANPGKATEGED